MLKFDLDDLPSLILGEGLAVTLLEAPSPEIQIETKNTKNLNFSIEENTVYIQKKVSNQNTLLQTVPTVFVSLNGKSNTVPSSTFGVNYEQKTKSYSKIPSFLLAEKKDKTDLGLLEITIYVPKGSDLKLMHSNLIAEVDLGRVCIHGNNNRITLQSADSLDVQLSGESWLQVNAAKNLLISGELKDKSIAELYGSFTKLPLECKDFAGYTVFGSVQELCLKNLHNYQIQMSQNSYSLTPLSDPD